MPVCAAIRIFPLMTAVKPCVRLFSSSPLPSVLNLRWLPRTHEYPHMVIAEIKANNIPEEKELSRLMRQLENNRQLLIQPYFNEKRSLVLVIAVDSRRLDASIDPKAYIRDMINTATGKKLHPPEAVSPECRP